MIHFSHHKEERFFSRSKLAALCMGLALLTCACAASRPPNPAGPNPNAPRYPILLTDETGARSRAALDAWARLMREQGVVNPPPPELHPVTSTIRSLPTLPSPIYLPKVGASPAMTEEETREALRRFINGNSELLGIEPQQLSLVLRTDAADGTKRALYEQRPFRYPFGHDYGIIEITFAPDRRVLQLTSTTIPEIERLRGAGSGLNSLIQIGTPELAAQALVGKTLTYTDASGRSATYTVTASDRVNPREMVIYPLVREGEPPAIEFHLVWEIELEGTPVRVVYLDAVTKEVIAAQQTTVRP